MTGPASGPLLTLLRLASPALPVGGFSYSDVLEAAIDAGLVRDEGTAAHWLMQQLSLVQARADMPLVAAAHRAWLALSEAGANAAGAASIERLNAWVLQTRETRELRLQTEQMGRSLADWLRQRHPLDVRCNQLRSLAPAPSWPLGFALAGALGAADPDALLQCFGFAWAENMVQAALKAVPLGQSAGQRLLDVLCSALPAAAAEAARRSHDEAHRQSFAPRLAMLSARHEAQYSRLFRS